jgi:hypothetical protein
MLHLQNGIPALEARLVRLMEPATVSTHLSSSLGHLEQAEHLPSTASLAFGRVDKNSRIHEGQCLEPSKGVREGKLVCELYSQLKRIRSLYRNTGRTISQIYNDKDQEFATTREWIDRINDQTHKAEFLKVHEWEDGDEFIFLHIAALYRYTPHLKRKPSWNTVRDWRKAYLGHLRHKTRDGRKPRQ